MAEPSDLLDLSWAYLQHNADKTVPMMPTSYYFLAPKHSQQQAGSCFFFLENWQYYNTNLQPKLKLCL